jgi:hypothetical protein
MMVSHLPLIQGLWIGGELSVMEQLCIASFLYHGHEFHLYVYDEVRNVPAGAVIKDANAIVPRERIFTYKEHNSVAGFSNIFRYKLLLEKGGYWVDMDLVCLKPVFGHKEYMLVAEYVRNAPDGAIQLANCIMGVPAGCEFIEYCYDVANKSEPGELRWGDIGPKLVSKAVKHFDMWQYVLKPDYFCPVNWWEWPQFLDGSLDTNKLHRAQGVHLWNEMWRRAGVNKSAVFGASSFYEQLKRQYLSDIIDQ